MLRQTQHYYYQSNIQISISFPFSGGQNAFNYVSFVVAILTLVVNVNNNVNNNNNNLNQVTPNFLSRGIFELGFLRGEKTPKTHKKCN